MIQRRRESLKNHRVQEGRKAQCLSSSETESLTSDERVMSSNPTGDIFFMKEFFMGEMRMVCRRKITMMRMMRMRKKTRRRMILPEVHNPPSLFGGEFRRRRGFMMQGLEASGFANVCRLPTHLVEDEIEMKDCLFAGRKSNADEDPVVDDQRKIVSELAEGGEPRRNRAEDWTARRELSG